MMLAPLVLRESHEGSVDLDPTRESNGQVTFQVVTLLLCGALGLLGLAPQVARAACGSFGNAPRTSAPVCNYWKCTSDGWVAWPYSSGALCSFGGQNGTCDGGATIPGQNEPDQLGLCVTKASLVVNGGYTIAGVWYAMPGAGSTTTYASQSQTGTTVSRTQGTGETVSVQVDNVAGFMGLMAGAYSFSYSQAWSQSSSTKIDKLITYNAATTIPGTSSDYIDHNYDQILLLLGPRIVFTGYTANGTMSKVTWAEDDSLAIPYAIQVGWLNGAWGPMPQNMAADLLTWGNITQADYLQILAADPYAHDPDGDLPPDPLHYECIEQIQYSPGNPDVLGFSISNTYSSQLTATVSHTYTKKLAITGTWLYQKLGGSDQWTWSNSSSSSNTSTSSVSMSVNLHQPTLGYSGPTVLNVYVDKIYKTLLYSFVPPASPNQYCW